MCTNSYIPSLLPMLRTEQAVSTLSLLEPFRRALLRIPFLYQKVSSTTPITALISTKSSHTSMTTVNVDGTLDWMVTGHALLAWTGQALSITPTYNRKMVSTNAEMEVEVLIVQESCALG